MIENCPICGKGFEVLWPHLWAYKRNSQFICSWKCLRAADNENERSANMGNRVPDEAKKKAIQAALDGKDPYEPLRPYTSNPKSMWTYIRSCIKQKDPELFEKIPDLRDRKKPKQEEPKQTLGDVMVDIRETADKFFGECEKMGLMKAEEPEEPEEPKIYQPVVYDGMTVREVEGGFGRYRRSDVHGSIYIDFEYTEGSDVLSLTVEQWRSFLKELEKSSAILGVSL